MMDALIEERTNHKVIRILTLHENHVQRRPDFLAQRAVVVDLSQPCF